MTIDESTVMQLVSMGFPQNRAEKAVHVTRNQGADVAMNWLFEHMEDADIDAPIPTAASTSSDISDAAAMPLTEMGFTLAQAKKALRKTDSNAERAVEWLFSHPEDDGSEDAVAADPASATGTCSVHDFYGNMLTYLIGAYDTAPQCPQYKLVAFISHKGTSTSCGHYCAHVKKTLPDGSEQWVLFNDNKVVKAASPVPLGDGYIYFFRKVENEAAF